MTEAVAIPPDTRAIVQRRLVGLTVLLIAAFIISLLLRARAPAPDALPSVVIPLSSTAASGPAPLLDAPEPEAESAPSLSEAPRPAPQPVAAAEPKPAAAAPKPTAKPVEKPAVEKPVVEKPLAEKPAAVKPKPTAPKPTPAAPEKPAATPSKPAQVSKPAVAEKPEKTAATARWFVAVGAYKDPMAAQAIVSRIKMVGFAASSAGITSAGERLNRVRAGPFASKAEAESARATLIVEGLTKATVLSEK